MTTNRVHLIAHARPIGPDITRFGFADADEYVAFIREHLPPPLRLTCNRRLIAAEEDPWNGGRVDDATRIRDLQSAIDDPKTVAVVAAGGGAYFSRIVPHLNLSSLARRRQPLWTLGFSEMTTLVNLVASYRGGRGLYWLCPNWLAWHVRPVDAARSTFAEFWRVLPEILAGRQPAEISEFSFGPIQGELVTGRVRSSRVRLVGGCLAVLAANVGGKTGHRLRPDGKWLLLEDIKESPYRIDRHLAALKVAGWLDRVAGLVAADFRMMNQDTQPAVLELLKYHLPKDRRVPIITTRSLGHVWPMVPVLLNRPLAMSVRRRDVTIENGLKA